MSKRINEIMKMIEDPKIKAISFDLFDTLVMRPVIDPPDIFTLIGAKTKIRFFKQRRIAAERRAMLFKDFYKETVNLNQIYESYQVMFGTTDKETEKIKQIELEIEYDLLYVRKSVRRLYNFAQLKGKKIIIVSDMYLPAEFLEKILEKNGYKKYSKIYVSCEENATKRNGLLYDKIIFDLEEEGIWTENIFHIGDNLKSDIEAAEKKGIKTIHIPKASDVFKKCSRLSKILDWRMPVYDGHHTLMIGLLANMLFDDPFIEFDKDSRYNGDANYMGLYTAPFFVSFMLWLSTQIRKDGIEQLVLVWRDGYMVEKILEIFEPHLSYQIPQIKRVYLSRAARYPFYSLDKGGLFDSFVQWALDSKTTVMQFIEKYLMLTNEEDINSAFEIFIKYGYTSRYQELGKAENYNWFAYEFESLFKKGAEEHRNLLGKHISFMKNGEKTGLFDIGYRGTTSRFLKSYYDIDSTGYHLLGTMGIHESYDGGELKAFVEYGFNTVLNTKIILHKFMELIISEQMPSVVGFKSNNTDAPDLIIDDNFEPDENISKLQEGILEYTHQFVELFGNYIDLLSIDRYVFWIMMNAMLSSPNRCDADLIKSMQVNISYFSGRQETFQRWYNEFFPKPASPKSSKK